MKVMYDVASMPRKAIGKSKPWCFNGSLLHPSDEHLRGLLIGPNTTLSNDANSSVVSTNAITLTQTTVTMFGSKHQIIRKATQTLRTVREMPNQLAAA